MFRGISSHISGRLVLALFTAANAVYMVMLTYSIPKLMAYTNGLPLFDMSPFGYSYQDAIALLSALGEEGRNVYASLQLALDLFYPLLFALCYSALLLWLVGLGKFANRLWSYLANVPILVCLFDYAENVSIWFMLAGYPELSENLVAVSSAFTLIKSVLTMTYFIGLILAIYVLVHGKIFRCSKKAVS